MGGYEGNEGGVRDEKVGGGILKEYKEEDNVLRGNKWYEIKIENGEKRVGY